MPSMICLRLFEHWARRAASRADCTAGSNRATATTPTAGPVTRLGNESRDTTRAPFVSTTTAKVFGKTYFAISAGWGTSEGFTLKVKLMGDVPAMLPGPLTAGTGGRKAEIALEMESVGLSNTNKVIGLGRRSVALAVGPDGVHRGPLFAGSGTVPLLVERWREITSRSFAICTLIWVGVIEPAALARGGAVIV